MRILIIAASVAILAAPFVSGAQELVFSSPAPLQGDTVVVSTSREISSATFDGEPMAVFPYRGAYRAVFGIPAAKPPGNYPLKVVFADGGIVERNVRVRARKFARIDLGVPKELGLTPTQLTEKLAAEKVNIDKIAAVRTPEIFFASLFGLPLRNNRKVGSPFGEIRKTGGSEIRHLGVDLTATSGAAVAAINGGVVRKAYFDTVYGNMVILDHGQGIFSLYLHLKEIRVKEGDTARKGRIIGTVGKTGYAFAPHLHLSLKVGGVSVDPIRFVNAFR